MFATRFLFPVFDRSKYTKTFCINIIKSKLQAHKPKIIQKVTLTPNPESCAALPHYICAYLSWRVQEQRSVCVWMFQDTGWLTVRLFYFTWISGVCSSSLFGI